MILACLPSLFYFNAGENKVVLRGVEIPLLMAEPQIEQFYTVLKKYRVSHSISMVKSIRNWSTQTEISTLTTYGSSFFIKQATFSVLASICLTSVTPDLP